MATGKLVVINNKILLVQFTNSKGKQVSFNIKESELSASLTKKKKTSLAQLNGLEVEFEQVAGQTKQIREKGTLFQAPQSSTVTTSASSRLPQTVPMGDFHNPYNFVPALKRNSEVVQKSELGDHFPVDHGSYQDSYWSGKISVTLTTVTPLLIPDAAKATGEDHKTYPIRVGLDGKPYLPPTSIKGMLRSAYEAVTNSRLSVFAKHEDRLAYRMPTTLGLQMVPARIEEDENGVKNIRLYSGTSQISNNGTPTPNLMYAAWLPRYERGQISRNAVKYSNGELPQHKQEVEAWIEKFQHYRWDKKQNQHIPDFHYWRVREIAFTGETLGNQPQSTSDKDRHSCHKPLGEIKKIHGFVCLTNANIDKKHDERVFFDSGSQVITCRLTEMLEKQWKELITNYQEIHEDEICKKHKQSPPALNNSVWSRHIKGINYTLATQERDLGPGTLCYARVNKRNNGDYEILGLYPVIIARELYNISPLILVPEELRPATNMESLSPADRVFGWVNQNGQGSYKGNLRISAVECESANAVENFAGDGLPLAILGQPKPQQARFYVAKDNQGTPLNQGISKQEGYQVNYGLRGRKVYPHHANLPAEYWENPLEDRTQNAQNGHFQEYRRPQKNGKERDDQNRSIKGWVKPDVTFNFEIDVTNLSEVELGGILWLLSLPEGCYHRLGGGKPLGFGSVKLAINWEATDLRTGKDWRKFYSCLEDIPNSNLKEAEASIDKFKDALVKVYGDGQSFEEVLFIKAFCRGAQGFDDNKPIHYPRKRQKQGQNPVPPHPEGKAFEWFVANEKVGNSGGPKVSLPALWDEHGLPYFDPS